MKIARKILILSLFTFNGLSQDLILNGDFEDINMCSEYFVPCSPEAWRLTSSILPQYHEENGNHYLGFVVYNSSFKNIRGYLQSPLADKLQTGKKYKLSIDIRSGDIFIESIGVIFSDSMILTNTNHILNRQTMIDFRDGKSLLGHKGDEKWLHLSNEFNAVSEAQYIIIGCFIPDDELKFKIRKTDLIEYHDYYFNIDNIHLTPLDTKHDTLMISNKKESIYSQDYRHPVPDALFNLKAQEEMEVIKIDDLSIDTILLYNDFLFEFDSYKPYDHIVEKIDSIFSNITMIIDSIAIIGHTDNVGDDSYNDLLSFKRAEIISNYLVSKGIVEQDRIAFFGKGSNFPKASNLTEIGRSKNRRVEIIIKYKGVH